MEVLRLEQDVVVRLLLKKSRRERAAPRKDAWSRAALV